MRLSKRLVTTFQSRKLATTTKRLDICAAQFAFVLQSARIKSIKGWRCLEVGAGWVLSHSVVMHLLGASETVGTDLEPLAHPESLRVAVRSSVKSIVRDILSPFEDHSQLRERLNHLVSMHSFSLANLASLGNLVPHLHWHVIPRFASDSHYPQPIWGTRQRDSRTPPLPGGFAQALAARLAAGPGRG